MLEVQQAARRVARHIAGDSDPAMFDRIVAFYVARRGDGWSALEAGSASHALAAGIREERRARTCQRPAPLVDTRREW